MVCQDTDQDGACSGAEPFVMTCGTTAVLSRSRAPFRADTDTRVIVVQPQPLGLARSVCGSPVVGGSITIQYA
jgi:hypothetical protein